MKTPSNGSGEVKDLEVPSVEIVRQWVKRDVNAAAYFLNMIRNDDELIADVANLIYQKAMDKKRDDEVLKDE